jgi:hypothetical protein
MDPPEPDVFSYDNAIELEPTMCQLQYCYRTGSKPEPEPDVLSYDNAIELEPITCLATIMLQN